MNKWQHLILKKKLFYLVGGDFDANFPLWNSPTQSRRGPKLIDFLAYNNLHTLNSIDNSPKFRKSGKEGWSDLIICNAVVYIKISNKKIINFNNNTDHTYMTHELNAVSIHAQRGWFTAGKENHSKNQTFN